MFEKMTEHIYVRPQESYSDRPNIGLICGKDRTLLYDAGNSAANVALMREELAQEKLPQPDLLALSHWHWDHTFGAYAWDIPVIAGRETNRHLRKMQDWKWDDASMQSRVERNEDIVFCAEMIKREYPDPDRSQICIKLADIVFDDRLTVDLGGGVVCELIHARGPHSSDSVLCYVPSEKFLFLGDSNGKDLYGQPWEFDIDHEENLVPTLMSIPYDRELVKEYLKLLDTLDFDWCIGGHAEAMSRQALYNSLTT